MNQLIEQGVKVDMILTDIPYGTTPCKWDTVIPLDEMWKCIKGISKENTPTLLFGVEPLSSAIRMSNITQFRYDWIWDKMGGANFLNANRTPLPSHEVISVFYEKMPCYHPQKTYSGKKYNTTRKNPSYKHNTYVKLNEWKRCSDGEYRFPLSIIQCSKYEFDTKKSKRMHPTQKPVPLLEYLIRTYTNPEDVVLDFTMGSGSTGVACMNTSRRFIGIELEEKYYNIAEKRIKYEVQQTTLPI